ncbi:uncharacterized protein LOC132300158 isoform X2 [Cornus florida]|nr:uncharacterized protein LOC132300158 isoform X2 [Cornus florida]
MIMNNDDDDDFESPTMGPDPQIPDPPQTLKRLRRGRTTESTSATHKRELWRSVDEEIEKFFSHEDKREGSITSSLLGTWEQNNTMTLEVFQRGWEKTTTGASIAWPIKYIKI